MSDGDLLTRLRRARATLPEHSPQDRAIRDAVIHIESLRAELALITDVMFHLWDEMETQDCINFSATHPRHYIVANDEWQRRAALRGASVAAQSTPKEDA